MKRKENLVSYLFLAPFLLVYIVFLAYPVIYSFFLSFHKVSIYTDMFDVFRELKFVGFSNYIQIITKDYNFWWSLVLTFFYAIMTIPAGIFLSLFLAIMLNNKLKGKTFFRAAYFLPNVLDMFVIGTIWVFIYAPTFGIIVRVLNFFGITYFNSTGLLGNPYTALASIGFAMVLKGCGFGMILFLVALQNIPESVYEAAKIDGANWWQELKHITIPLLKPVFLFLIVTGIMAGLNAFTEIYAMTNSSGGPNIVIAGKTMGATSISGFYLWKQFDFGRYGYAASISYVMLAIALTLTYINFKIIKPYGD
ncbi:sugar ABC transporter permease [bacterium]|nr:sugar ABC transporter permease [bacterium]